MEHSLSYVTDEQRRMTEIEALKGVADFVCVALERKQMTEREFVAFETKATDRANYVRSDEGFVSKTFPGHWIGNVYLDNRCFYGSNGISDGNRSMCISRGIEDNTLITSIRLLQLIHYFSFVIGLEVVDLVIAMLPPKH